VASDGGSPSGLKNLDRLVLKELIGPWIFGVAMFSALVMAGQILNKMAEYVVRGLPPSVIFKVTMLLMPAILAKTFAMAVLLAALLGFGRLSSDSEVTALRAAGASLIRIIRPVMMFSLVIAIITFFFNNEIVPPAAAKAQDLILSLDNKTQAKAGEPISFPIVNDGKLQAQVVAQAFDSLERKLFGVTIIAYNDAGDPTLYMHCHELDETGGNAHVFTTPNENNWHIRGGASIVFADGGPKIDVKEMWPASIPKVNLTSEDIKTSGNKDMDSYSMADALRQIQRGRRDGNLSPADIHNLEYGYWSKISVALAAFVFGILGAVLGIRNQRSSAASGFALAIGIIFCYFTLANFMNVWALNGILPAWVASFSPIFIGLVFSAVIMWRRNT